MPTTLEKVQKLIIEQLGVINENITPESSFRLDLGADSLDSIELVMAAEAEFEIVIQDEYAEKIETVGDAVKLIDSLLSLSAGQVRVG